MGGGGGSRGGGGTTTSTVVQNPDPEAQALMKFIRTQAIEKILPDLTNQVLEALRTGGVGAQIPIIQRAVEASRGATAATLRQTSEELSRVGQAGTPFGQTILANQRTLGEMATAGIPLDIAQQFLQIAPALSVGATGQILPGFGRTATTTGTESFRTRGGGFDAGGAALNLLGSVLGAFTGGLGGGFGTALGRK